MASNRSLSYLYNTLNFVNLYNENRSTLHCLDTGASQKSNGFLLSVSKSMIGNELLWRLLQELCYGHYMTWKQTYEKTFSTLENDFKGLDNSCPRKFCPLQGKFRQINAFIMANLLRRTIIIMDAVTSVEDIFCTTFLPTLHAPEECIDRLSRTFYPPIVLSYIDERRDHILPLIPAEGVLFKLPKDLLDNSHIYGANDRSSVGLYLNNDGESYIFASGNDIKDPHELVKSLDHAFLEQYGISLHIICDYIEDILEETEYTDEIWSKLSGTMKDIRRAILWRCLVCWRLSMTPAVEQYDLYPGGIVYERILKENSSVFDGVHYRDEIFGVYDYNALNDRFQLQYHEMCKCLHCKRRMFQMRRQMIDCRLEYRNGDHTWEPSFKNACIRRKKHFWSGRSHDHNPIIITIRFEYSSIEDSRTAEIFWFKDDNVPNYRARLEREMEALTRIYKIDTPLRDKIRSYLLICLKNETINIECSDELWNMNRQERMLDGETIIFAGPSGEEAMRKYYGFKIIGLEERSSITSSVNSTILFGVYYLAIKCIVER